MPRITDASFWWEDFGGVDFGWWGQYWFDGTERQIDGCSVHFECMKHDTPVELLADALASYFVDIGIRFPVTVSLPGGVEVDVRAGDVEAIRR